MNTFKKNGMLVYPNALKHNPISIMQYKSKQLIAQYESTDCKV